MPSTPRIIEQRIENIESQLGITGLGTPISDGIHLPVGSIYLTKDENGVIDYGTWELLASGNLLGGQVGTVYVWKRTA